MTDLLLYGATVLLWGSSWIAIKFQLGVVAPEVSIAWRFLVASAILLVFCLATGRRLRFSLPDHGRMALQGAFLFSTNYLLIYFATESLTSGLVSVAFSFVVVFNIVLGAAFFGLPVRPRVALGAGLGIAGIALVFWPELRDFDLSSGGVVGLLWALGGTFAASIGMMISAGNQKRQLPVIQGNAWGMGYGALFMLAFALVRGTPLAFDPSATYVLSLLYLALFASVLAFGCYLTLLGRIGPDRAAYASVLFPVVALAISTMVEGYVWSLVAAVGVALVLAGNALVLRRG